MGVGNSCAQPDNAAKAVTHFYIVNFDNELLNFLNASKEDISNNSLNSPVTMLIMDTLYQISTQIFKKELGLELLPLNELQNKIKYNKTFPDCPDVFSINKVLKKASGYKYYIDYYVNIFSDVTNKSALTSSLSQIKPLYAISFTLYDSNGKVVKKFQYSYRSTEPLANDKEKKQISKQDIKTNLCSTYEVALKKFTSGYKKNLVASL